MKKMDGIVMKVLIGLYENEVSPWFDLSSEVLIAQVDEKKAKILDEKIVVLSQASAEMLCHMVLTESVQVVICGGIEDEYFQYLVWKRVKVLDSIIGSARDALERLVRGELHPGDILFQAGR